MTAYLKKNADIDYGSWFDYTTKSLFAQLHNIDLWAVDNAFDKEEYFERFWPMRTKLRF